MNILFINPKSSNIDALPIPPLGILYLASYIRSNGFDEIKVIDNNRENKPLDSLSAAIKEAEIIALTGTTSQFKEARDIAYLSKKYGKIVIFGGPHATFLAEEILKNTDIDIIVMGEGEVTFYKLLVAIKENIDLAAIEGIVFKKNNQIIRNKEREFIKNLDELPFPARDLVPINEYPLRELKRFFGAYTHMMSSRGCTGKCIFCSSPKMWKYPRMRSVANVFAEMMEIYNRYKIKNIHFQDDVFTINKKRVEEFCDLIIKSGIDFRWSCQAIPDNIDYNLLKKMKRAGCVQIEFGVESGDSELLRIVQKGYTKEEIKRTFLDAKKADISTYGFLIVGLPRETLWTWLKSIIFAKSLIMDSCVWTVLVPFPGTRVFDEKMVDIINPDYFEWRYKNPVIKSGKFGPMSLMIMRKLADIICNGFFNTGTYKTRRYERSKN